MNGHLPYLMLHSDAFSAELESLGLDSSLFGAAGVPAPIFQALMPRSAGTFDHNIVTYGTVDSPGTFSRSSSDGLYLDANGIIQTAASSIIRAEYDASGDFLGYLFEPAATNVQPGSNDFTGAAWSTGSGLVLAANADTSPDGSLTAWTATDNDATAGSSILDIPRLFSGETIASNTDRWVGSMFLKKTSGSPSVFPVFGFHLSGGAVAVIVLASLNTTTGAVAQVPITGGWGVTPNYDNAWVDDYGDYWRLSVGVTDPGGNILARIRFYPAYSSTLGGVPDRSLTGSQTIWHAELVKEDVPSSIIPTGAGSVTRAVDILSWATDPSEIDLTAGFLLADINVPRPAADYLASTSVGIFSIQNVAASLMSLSLNEGGANRVIFTNDGGTDATVDVSSQSFRAAVRWDATNMIAGYDSGSGFSWGTQRAINAIGTDNVTKIGLSASVPLWIKRVRLFNRALSTAEIGRVFAL